jgi:hypothetical protein
LGNKTENPVTENDVRAIVGPLDDDIVLSILEIGATHDEIMQAFDWLEESRYTMSAFEKPMNERAHRVYQILDYASNHLGNAPVWH